MRTIGHTLAVFRACLPRRGRKAEDDRRFLEALHFFTVENVRWRALPGRFGPWNSVYRLSKAGVFEAFYDTLASMSLVRARSRLTNRFSLRCSSRMRPLKLSQKPFCVGFPGAMKRQTIDSWIRIVAQPIMEAGLLGSRQPHR